MSVKEGIIISNHGAEPQTEEALRSQFGVDKVSYYKHPNINPEWGKDKVWDFADTFIVDNIYANRNDSSSPIVIAVINGEYGFSTACVAFLSAQGIKCVYPTTERMATEHIKPDGSIELTHTYKFVAFREW